MAKNKKTGSNEPKKEQITVTEEYILAHPEVVEQGVVVGDVIEVETVEVPEVVEEVKPSKTKSSGVNTVVFKLKLHSPKTRTFSKEVHGEDFMELAKKYEVSNASVILSKEEF